MRAARQGAAARGFTLVELMVAIVAGLFVSMAVFTLAKHASAFATQQARMADATLQGVIGFERLKADIARAGFLSSPNAVRDPNICRNAGAAGYPNALARLASVAIETIPDAELSVEQQRNGLTPRRITLAGSYDSADLFVARHISEGENTVYLSVTGLGMANIHYTPDEAGAEALGRVFREGRALRIVDDAGGVQFAAIRSVSGGANPSIVLEADPSVEFRAGNALNCGVRGLGNDFVNVVNIIRYDVRNLSEPDADPDAPAFGAMYRGGPSYDTNRTELVRFVSYEGPPRYIAPNAGASGSASGSLRLRTS